MAAAAALHLRTAAMDHTAGRRLSRPYPSKGPDTHLCLKASHDGPIKSASRHRHPLLSGKRTALLLSRALGCLTKCPHSRSTAGPKRQGSLNCMF